MDAVLAKIDLELASVRRRLGQEDDEDASQGREASEGNECKECVRERLARIERWAAAAAVSLPPPRGAQSVEAQREQELLMLAVNGSVARACDELACLVFAYYCRVRAAPGGEA